MRQYLHPLTVVLVICLSVVSMVDAVTADSPTSDSSASAGCVAEMPRQAIRVIAQQIDSLVQQKLDEKSQKTNRRADDETFLRCIYLDVIGRIPTLEESQSFLSSKDRNKCAALIDRLLDSPGYVSHQFNYWADVLRIKNRLQGGNPGQPYIDYVKESIQANKPYDQFVRELLTAEGSALERGNGATGYFLRDVGMPEDNMANTARIFLGTKIECAQCHDHPFDKWSQRDFYEMVAFTGGLQTRFAPHGLMGAMQTRKKIRESDAPAKVKQLAANLLRPLSYGVSGGGTGLVRLPDSYQYDDGEPNEIVTAKTLFEDKEIVHPTIPVSRRPARMNKRKGRNANRIFGAQDIDSRQAFADWLTSPDNPRFSQVIANRMWKQAMGLALIEPLDDLTDESKASNEELLAYLTEQIVDLDYDLRQFQRAIFYSDTYQRESTATDIADPAKYSFPGPVLRRMSAEQLWDSFVVLAVPDVDTRENPRQKIGRFMMGTDVYESFARVKEMSIDEVLELAEKQVEIRENPSKRRERIQEMMMDMETSDTFSDEAKQLRQELVRLKRMQQQAQKRKRPAVARSLQQKVRDVQQHLKHLPTRQRGDLVRASELPSPAPPGHFLREFGQSDREQIQNANSEAAVTQVLSLMNGQIEKQIIANPRTVLMRNVVLAENPTDKIEVIFLSMLGRNPTRAERTTWLTAEKEYGSDAANDLIWTLANSSEFMFVR